MPATLVSIDEYLSTTYHPDRDYVDGEILERNVGEYDHGKLQLVLGGHLLSLQRKLGIDVVVETRVQVSSTRFRIPDICVLRPGAPPEQIIRTPPFLCIEILSPEDRMSQMQQRVDDYLNMGVEYVTVINPQIWHTYTFTKAGVDFNTEGLIRTQNPAIEINARELPQ